jgi:hypothetical protein
LTQDADLFIALAEIAGVFVGFGALISFTRQSEIDVLELGQIRGVVSIGLVVMVAALIPAGIGRYGFTGRDLWLPSAVTFLALIWIVIFISLWSKQAREHLIAQAKVNPLAAGFFWLFLEVPIQLPLLLIILGSHPELEPAFYTTALVLNLIEAAFILAQLVFSQATSADP